MREDEIIFDFIETIASLDLTSLIGEAGRNFDDPHLRSHSLTLWIAWEAARAAPCLLTFSNWSLP